MPPVGLKRGLVSETLAVEQLAVGISYVDRAYDVGFGASSVARLASFTYRDQVGRASNNLGVTNAVGESVVSIIDARMYQTVNAATGEQAALRIESKPVLGPVSQIATSHGIHINALPVGQPLSIITDQNAINIHWDTLFAGTTTTARGVYAHVGALASTVTNLVAYDGQTAQGFGSTVTTTIGLRISALATATNSWAFQMVGSATTGQSQHQGKLGIGGSAIDSAPGAWLDVTASAAASEICRRTTVTTSDDPRVSYYQDRWTTTNATTTPGNIALSMAASSVYYVTAYVWARRTGGSSGTAEDGAAYRIDGYVSNQAMVTQATTVIGENQAAWTSAFALGYGILTIGGTGAANNNVTWHCELIVRGPLNA